MPGRQVCTTSVLVLFCGARDPNEDPVLTQYARYHVGCPQASDVDTFHQQLPHPQCDRAVYTLSSDRPSRRCVEESESPAQGLIAGRGFVLCTVWVPGTSTWRTFLEHFNRGTCAFSLKGHYVGDVFSTGSLAFSGLASGFHVTFFWNLPKEEFCVGFHPKLNKDSANIIFIA